MTLTTYRNILLEMGLAHLEIQLATLRRLEKGDYHRHEDEVYRRMLGDLRTRITAAGRVESPAQEREEPTRPAGPPGGFQIRFDGPPGPVAGRFVEVETLDGRGAFVGEWIQEGEYWLLRIATTSPAGPADLAGEREAERTAADLVREISAINVEMVKHDASSQEFKWWLRRLVETRLQLRELVGANEADQAEEELGDPLEEAARTAEAAHSFFEKERC